MTANTLTVFNLDDYRDLFRDSESFGRFVSAFRVGMSFDLRTIVSGEQVLGAALSPDGAKEMILEKFARKMVQNPKFLEELAHTLEHDEIVD